MAFQLKPKKRGRGRPFAKGNKHGNRFPKGISGCPGGRSRYRALLEAYKAALELDEKEKFEGPRTNAEAIALAMVEEARNGKVPAASEISDRLYGKPRQAYEVKLSITDELPNLIEEGRKRVAARKKK